MGRRYHLYRNLRQEKVNLEEFLEMILLVADLNEIKGNLILWNRNYN